MDQRNSKTVIKLVLMGIGMFGFAFALVPLYDLLCDITGLNGKTDDSAYQYDAAMLVPDKSRLVKVNFITNTNGGMPWEFYAEKGGVRVHPGELKEVVFHVKNTTQQIMVAQAVPSISPSAAAQYFHKTECFCFTQQLLNPGEELDMPMRFIIGPELPKNIKTVSLSYALFDVTELAARGTIPAGQAG